MRYFVAYHYFKDTPTVTRSGVGNCVTTFSFHPLTDPVRAGAEIAAACGYDEVIVINVQPVPTVGTERL